MSRRASRSALDPSPNVILPATSTTLTSPTCRVLSFTLTEICLLALIRADCNLSLGHQVLDQSYFRAGRLQPPYLEVVHERFDQENSAPGMPQQVLLRQGVR